MSLVRQSFKLRILFKKYNQISYSAFLRRRSFKKIQGLSYSTDAITPPTPEGCEKVYPPKIRSIVEEIAKLTLIEVVDLNECLKKTLNIKDVPMAMGAMPVAAAAPAQEEDEEPVVTKTSFTVKLVSFDQAKKVPLIKEIKNKIEGMNLVQAKKFVESVPQTVRADISSTDAEELKKALEAVGGTCEIC